MGEVYDDDFDFAPSEPFRPLSIISPSTFLSSTTTTITSSDFTSTSTSTHLAQPTRSTPPSPSRSSYGTLTRKQKPSSPLRQFSTIPVPPTPSQLGHGHGQPKALSSTTSSSSSSRHAQAYGSIKKKALDPDVLKRFQEEKWDDDFDFIISQDPTPKILSQPRLHPTPHTTTSTSHSASTSTSSLKTRITSVQPNPTGGPGTITRFEPRKKTNISPHHEKGEEKRRMALAKDWEKDLDLGTGLGFESKREEDKSLSFSARFQMKQREQKEQLEIRSKLKASSSASTSASTFGSGGKAKGPVKLTLNRGVYDAPDDLDDLDLFGSDDDQETLKIGDTIKGKLPPPKSTSSSTLRKQPSKSIVKETESMEDDFILPSGGLPLNMANLARNARHYAGGGGSSIKSSIPRLSPSTSVHPHSSRKARTHLDSPTNSSISMYGKNSHRSDGFDASETSATSITSIRTPKDTKSFDMSRSTDEDDLSGLELPPTIGKRTLLRKLELRNGMDWAARPFEKGAKGLKEKEREMDHGLVIRGNTLALSGTVKTMKARDAEKMRLKERERDWDRGTSSSRQDMVSNLGVGNGSFRSHSASKASFTKPATHLRPRTSHSGVDSLSANSLSAMANHPPRTLVRQQSTMNLGTPGPSLSKKQSMPVLTERAERGERADLTAPPTPTQPFDSLSRHTIPRHLQSTTSSSLKAKPKSRGFIPAFTAPSRRNASFDRDSIPDTSSVSSVSTGASARDEVTATKYGSWRSTGSKGGSSKRPPIPSQIKKKLAVNLVAPVRPAAKVDEDALSRIADLEVKDAPAPVVTKQKKGPGLVKWLGNQVSEDGANRFNPQTGLWESDERDEHVEEFDRLTQSQYTRPALITPAPTSKLTGLDALSAMKIVDDMLFDPKQMCWVSIAPAEEEVIDWGDDDENDNGKDEDGDEGGGTIRAKGLVQIGKQRGMGRHASTTNTNVSMVSGSTSSRLTSVSEISTRSMRESIGEPGGYVTRELKKECQVAEMRHREEMHVWRRYAEKDQTEDDKARVEWERLMERKVTAMTRGR